jgi:hypothetical protein
VVVQKSRKELVFEPEAEHERSVQEDVERIWAGDSGRPIVEYIEDHEIDQNTLELQAAGHYSGECQPVCLQQHRQMSAGSEAA